MTAKRAIYAGLGAVAVLVAMYFFATPLSWFLYRVGVEVEPARVSWDGKTAWIRCESAIAGKTAWPDTAQAACQAMHLCANEAPLNEAQREKLYQAIKETKGCEEP